MEKAVLMMAKKVLIVEDDSNIAELLNLYLEKEGFEVRCFEDGESILAACEEQMPDLCILDVMMPKKMALPWLRKFDQINSEIPNHFPDG